MLWTHVSVSTYGRCLFYICRSTQIYHCNLDLTTTPGLPSGMPNLPNMKETIKLTTKVFIDCTFGGLVWVDLDFDKWMYVKNVKWNLKFDLLLGIFSLQNSNFMEIIAHQLLTNTVSCLTYFQNGRHVWGGGRGLLRYAKFHAFIMHLLNLNKFPVKIVLPKNNPPENF